MKEDGQAKPGTLREWQEAVEGRLSDKARQPLELAQEALRQYPDDGTLLEPTAFAAVVEERPDSALRYLKKLERLFYLQPSFYLLK